MMSSFVSIGQTPPRPPFFLMIVSLARDAISPRLQRAALNEKQKAELVAGEVK